MDKRKTLKDIYNIIVLLFIFISANAWFAYMLPLNFTGLGISALMAIILINLPGGLRVTKQMSILLAILIVYMVWTVINVDPIYGMIQFFTFLPGILLCSPDREDKSKTLAFITKWYGIVITISMVIFLAVKATHLPGVGIFRVPNNNFYAPYYNYLFYIKMVSHTYIERFNGPFLEPGHLALVSFLILFANRFDFKKSPWMYPILLSVCLSFSLVGYLLLIIGLILLKVKNVWSVVLGVGLIWGAYVFCTEIWDGGDNKVNTMILSRLELDESKGIKGNNRTPQTTDGYYERLKRKDALWVGMGTLKKNDSIAGSGYKIYFIRFGIISALIVFLYYTMLFDRKANKRYTYSFLLVIVLIFWQRAYPWWFSWHAMIILGTAVSALDEMRRKEKKELPQLDPTQQ